MCAESARELGIVNTLELNRQPPLDPLKAVVAEQFSSEFELTRHRRPAGRIRPGRPQLSSHAGTVTEMLALQCVR